jgi:biotin carboxylase
MRTLVVLGAGEDQLPTYREARRLGLRTIGVDQNPAAVAASEADEFLPVSTRDPRGVRHALRGRRIAGVISPASDASVVSARSLALAFGTPFCVSWDAARASVDKTVFRRLVDDLGLARYGWVAGTGGQELCMQARELTLPLAVKPTDSSGSKGLSIVQDRDELEAAIALAAHFSYGGEVIVEEFVDGVHMSGECLIANYRPSFMAIVERTITPLPHAITLEQMLPAAIADATLHELESAVARICSALDLERGPLNLDFVVCECGRVQLIEMAARPGGNGIPRVVGELYGVNLPAAAIKIALGEPVEVQPRLGGTGLLRILQAPHHGIVTAIGGVNAIRTLPEVLGFELFAQVGSTVAPYTEAGNKIGYLTVVGAGADDARAALDRALAHLQIEITEQN